MPDREYVDRFPTMEEFDEEVAEHGLEFEPSFIVQMRRALALALVIDESLGSRATMARGGRQAAVPAPSPSSPIPTPPATIGHCKHGIEMIVSCTACGRELPARRACAHGILFTERCESCPGFDVNVDKTNVDRVT